MQTRSDDTDPEAEQVQIKLLRRASGARRAQMALGLSAQVIGLARMAIRRSLANPTEEEVSLRFVEMNYGRDLADGVRERLASRAS